MTKVNRVRDSMKARPRTSRSWMPARAPGLRARASVAEAVALPWPSPQRPAAMAMPTPAPMGTRLAPPPPSVPWANAGVANSSADRVINRYCSLRIAFLLAFVKIAVQWVVDAHRAGALTLEQLSYYYELSGTCYVGLFLRKR